MSAPRPEGSHGGWDQVAEVPTAFDAELLVLRLREGGIEAQVVDQTFHQEPLPAVRSFAVVRVLVPTPQADEARRILSEIVPLPADGSDEP